MAIALLSGQTTNGSGTAQTLPASAGTQRFGISAFGTFGSGTIDVEFSPDGGTNYVPVASFTAKGFKVIEVISPDASGRLRATLSGATSPNVTCLMSGVLGIARTDA